MICIGNLKKSYISLISIAKPKNFIIFAFTYVSESPALFFVEISAGIHIVLTEMKRGYDELNASSFQFLRSLNGHCVIVMISYSALNASSQFILKKKHRLIFHDRYFY
jgi:hypothetical protein